MVTAQSDLEDIPLSSCQSEWNHDCTPNSKSPV